MRAAEILRAEYGTSRNFITPTIMRRLLVRHPETGEMGAAEISMGDGIRLREHETRGVQPRVYGVTIVWVGENGARRRTDLGEAYGCRVFHDEPAQADYWNGRFQGEGYREACEYVRTLGGKV